MRNKYLFLFVMIVVIASGLYFFILGDEREGGQTERAEKKRYIKSVYASGYVDSVNKVLIKPEVSGYIDRVYVSEGERVSEGQLLAVVRNDKLEQNLREIEARKELTEKINQIKIATEDGLLETAQKSLVELDTGIQLLGETCISCHENDSQTRNRSRR